MKHNETTRFKKKPIEIEAFQMTPDRRVDDRGWPEWLNNAWNLERGIEGSLYPTKVGTGCGTLSIGTLEGEQLVSWGDWIIQGVKGEIYPCKPDIFFQTYDPVDTDDTDDKYRPRFQNAPSSSLPITP